MKVNIMLRKLYSVKRGKLLVWSSAVMIVSAAFYQMSILIDNGGTCSYLVYCVYRLL
ncbi:MAG: hypothetical protein MI974_21355 [Chitinophagales bacterium]|nr:hypothetical protein [Chitinophagales bacterium]